MQPQGHSFLERKGHVKQLFLKSLPDCRNRVIPAMSSGTSALKVTHHRCFSVLHEATTRKPNHCGQQRRTGRWQGNTGILHNFYSGGTSCQQLLEKARPPGHQQQPGEGSGQQNACISVLRTWRCDWAAEQAGSNVPTGKLPWMKTQALPQKHKNLGGKKK